MAKKGKFTFLSHFNLYIFFLLDFFYLCVYNFLPMIL